MSDSGFGSLLKSSSNFDPNAILRGAQLTLVGANRALQNPALFTSEHYKQAALAVAAGIAIRLLVAIPTLGLRLLLSFIGLFTDLSSSAWDREIIDGIHYIEHHVLQVPFFLLSFMRYLSPAMDHMFMDSLAWVDRTYTDKHAGEDPSALREMYYPNLRMYGHGHGQSKGQQHEKRDPYEAMMKFLWRFGKRAGLSLGVYFASFLPVVGRFVLPAASFYTFNRAVGTPAAVAIFGTGLVLPKRYLVMFLQSYFASRSLMRELLEPYFSRIPYTTPQKKIWFREREGVLYGFALAFFVFLKIPLVGVLIYGIAEASTAYLVTKITEPPPPPESEQEVKRFVERDVRWENRHELLSLPLAGLDAVNEAVKGAGDQGGGGETKGKQYT